MNNESKTIVIFYVKIHLLFHTNMTVYTLCHIFTDSRILLGYKKRGVGQGYWNGFGGKPESGETFEQAVIREVAEESLVKVENVSRVGELKYKIGDQKEYETIHVFKAEDFMGEPQETEEMRPGWYNFDDIPYEKMWASDKIWLPYILQGKKIKAEIILDKDEKLINCDIKEVTKL